MINPKVTFSVGFEVLARSLKTTSALLVAIVGKGRIGTISIHNSCFYHLEVLVHRLVVSNRLS